MAFAVFLLLLVHITLVICQRPPPSPCPDVYYYETDGYQIYGVAEASDPPPYGSQMVFKIKLTVRAELPSDYVGKVELYEDRMTVLRLINEGAPIKYKIHFPIVSPLPNVVSVVFDDRIICSGTPAIGRVITTIDLEHTLRSGQAVLNNQPTYIRTTTPIAEYIYSTTGEPDRHTYHINDICGTTSTTIPLVVGGEAVERGDWPWLVAVFREKFGGLEFICGGSLISDRLVITAAHCVTNTEHLPVEAEEVVIRLGVHNIGDWADTSTVTTTVTKIKIRDYFKDFVFHNDIAVLVMARSVTFTDYIRPVCLWYGDNDQNQLSGKEGIVVGWGKDESGVKISLRPKKVSVPIVPITVCRGSNPKFFRLTSNTTLCAGNREGAGPCTGDSGSGLYMFRRSRWTIRGIVSHALRDKNKSCDLYQYVIYTDSSKYVSWIKDTE